MLEIKNLSYVVDEKKILSNIDLKFEKNSIVAITGQNGSGKTTLSKIIVGILPTTKGKIIFNGEDITNKNITERANLGITYAFQQPVKFKGITVQKLFEVASKNANISNVCDYLSKLGLCARNYLSRDFDDTLSGGERKRIELALALSRNAKIYIFDEPEASIDLWNFDKFINIFKSIKNNSLCVVITHEKKILELADNIIVLEKGKIKNYDSKKKILEQLDFSCEKLKGGINDKL